MRMSRVTLTLIQFPCFCEEEKSAYIDTPNKTQTAWHQWHCSSHYHLAHPQLSNIAPNMEIASRLPNAYLKFNLNNQKFPLLLWGSKICQHKPHSSAFQKPRNVGGRNHLMKRPDELLPGIRLEIIQHHLSDEQPGLACPRWPTLPIVNLSTHCWPSSSSAPVNRNPTTNSPHEYEFRIAVSYPSVEASRAAFPILLASFLNFGNSSNSKSVAEASRAREAEQRAALWMCTTFIHSLSSYEGGWRLDSLTYGVDILHFTSTEDDGHPCFPLIASCGCAHLNTPFLMHAGWISSELSGAFVDHKPIAHPTVEVLSELVI